MSSPLYRTFIMITPACLHGQPDASLLFSLKHGVQPLLSVAGSFVLLSSMVFFYLIHSGEEKELGRTFSFVVCTSNRNGFKTDGGKRLPVGFGAHILSRIKDALCLLPVIRVNVVYKKRFLTQIHERS